jgi:outer membrane lipoprotein carrier protein
MTTRSTAIAGIGLALAIAAGLLIARDPGGDDPEGVSRADSAVAGAPGADGPRGPGALPGADSATLDSTTVDPSLGAAEDPAAGGAGEGGGAAGGATGGGEPAREAPTGEAGDPGAQTPSTDRILRATADAFADVRSFRSPFEQTLRNPLLGTTTRARGTLYQRQPDRFLMRFTEPAGDRIVSDGESFWLYFPSTNASQVIRSSRGPGGLDLRSQFVGDPVRRFEATYAGREAVRGRAAHVLDLVPRADVGYRALKVWIDAGDHLIRRFELTEENGNVRHFELLDLAINPALADSLFQFTPPPGVRVVSGG